MLLGALSVGTAYSQTHRVGINTDNPRATLDISKVASGLPTGQAEGVIFPHMTQAQRNAMTTTQLTAGLMIYNTDKKCVDIWNGTNWQCSDGTKQDNQGDTPSSPSAVFTVTQLGFSGVYKANEALTDDNKVTFRVKNTGTVPSSAATITSSNLELTDDINNSPPVTVKSVDPTGSVVIAPGREVVITYTLQGTPRVGNLKAKFTHNGISDVAQTIVTAQAEPQLPQYVTLFDGERSFVSVYDADYWPYSGPTTPTAETTPQNVDGITTEPLVNIQGKIPTTGVEVYIPITVDPAIGHGSVQLSAFPGIELPVSKTHTQDNTEGKIKLSWASQTIRKDDTYIKATISAVGHDISLKKLDFQTGMGQDYKGIEIATFRYTTTQGGTQKASFVVRLMSGIPDRRFAIETKGSGGTDVYDHQFIYVPVVLTYNSITNPFYSHHNGQVWLNNNLGAEYTRVGSPVFDPGQQAKEHNDYNAFGSLFQWGRPADGHELVTYTNATTWQFKYSTTTNPTTTYPPQPSENQTVIPTITTESNGVDTTPMWYAGTTRPANYPITFSNDDNDVCPYGFKMPGVNLLATIINQSKSFDRMKDFFIRLPSNPKNVTNAGDNGTYAYGPKLWAQRLGFQNQQIVGGLVVRSHIAVAFTTDYYWNAPKQGWADYDSSGNLMNPGSYDYINGTYNNFPKHLRKFIATSYSTSFTFINGGMYSGGQYTGSGDVAPFRAITDSYAIRCIKL